MVNPLPPIAIVVAQTNEDILAESISEGLGRSSDVDRVCERVVSIQELFTLLNEEERSPDIVILVGGEEELAECSDELLAKHPSIVVARVVVGSEVVHMDVRQIDLNGLIQSLCGLFRHHTGDSQARLTEYRLMPEHAATTAGKVRLGLVAGQRRHTVLDKVPVWLDALLRLQLEKTVGLGNDLPGLSVSRATIEGLLQGDACATSPELLDAQAAVDAASAYLTQAIAEAQPQEDPLAALCKGLALSPLEIRAFLLCLAPELDAKYERIFGFIHDDLGRRNATLGLVASLLGDPLTTRMALANSDLFKRWRLFGTSSDSLPRGDSPLCVDPSLVAWIFGNRTALLHEARLSGKVTAEPWTGAGWLEAPVDVQLADTLQAVLVPGWNGPRWLVLAGNDAAAWRAILESAAGAACAPLLRVSLSALDGLDAAALDEQLLRMGWAARLEQATVAIDAHATALPFLAQASKRLVEVFADSGRVCVLIVRDILPLLDVLPADDYLLCQRDTPSNAPPFAAFAKAGAAAGLELSVLDSERLAAAYPLPLDGISRAMRLAVVRGASAEQVTERQIKILANACRDVACPDLPRYATALEPCFKLDEVVLPADRRQQLDDIVAHVSHARKVLGLWGFDAQLPYGKGVAALFSGQSGTGKTMAARAIGHALGRGVFAVDLSRVVSKYIGETEKNLDQVFYEAEQAGAILLFDEADALFGKRSEVKDAHDRYANIETAYLLQRMEAFGGLAILTTNFGQNLDRAFMRRLRFVVEFPMPDAAAREKIWRQCLPPQAPLADDIDLRFLSRRVEITGGNIRQITLRAAFAAAAEGPEAPISMRHILQATRAEVLKLGMAGLERELAGQAA